MSFLVQQRGEIISRDERSKISTRYKTVTRAINSNFWGINCDTSNSFYVGSYGRGTAVNTSDIDILIELPQNEYNRFDFLRGNGQSRLLQSVRGAVLNAYPRSDVRADGQIVKVLFSDGVKFELLPAFKNFGFLGGWDGSYIYPDTNMGGNWRSTNPKAEQEAMQTKNQYSNGLLNDTCKHMRRIRDDYFSSYHLSGIVIDSFAYNGIRDWRWLSPDESPGLSQRHYENELYDFLVDNIDWLGNLSLHAPGSDQEVDTENSLDCLEKVLKKMAGR